MRTRLVNLWDRLTGSYWFVPSCFVLLALTASLTLPYLDREHADNLPFVGDLPSTSTESARAVLTTVAGTMATVVGLVFSLTILTLSTATSQFGPRLLRNFLNNRSTQIALGTQVSTVIYALIVLQAMRLADADDFVPQISVIAALAATVFNMIYLVHFINMIATLVQAPNVVAMVAHDLDRSIDRLYPEELESAENLAGASCDVVQGASIPVCAHREGYLQGVDIEGLTHYATEKQLLLRLKYRPGQFVYRGSRLADVLGDAGEHSALEHDINQHIVAGHRRTPRQDVECALTELVELAVRALSEGINDPFTAMNCADRLGAALGRAARRNAPPTEFQDREGQLRLTIPAVTFAELLDTAFNQIRQHGSGNAAVLIRLLEALAEITRQCLRPGDACAILRHVEMIERTCNRSIDEPNDREDIMKRVSLLRPRLASIADSA